MVSGLFGLVLAIATIAVGVAHVRLSRRMRTFVSTPGKVVARAVVALEAVSQVEGRFGAGGGYRPSVRYRYTVAGVERESDKVTHVRRGLKHALAERALAAIPDDVVVWYNPARPEEAYLERHTPGLGYGLVAVGAAISLFALLQVVTR
jgi:hypothetical protein